MEEGGDPEKFGSRLSKHLMEQAYLQHVFKEAVPSGVRINRVIDVQAIVSASR